MQRSMLHATCSLQRLLYKDPCPGRVTEMLMPEHCKSRNRSDSSQAIFDCVSLCLQSAVLGFGIFRVLERYGWTSSLSIGENVILQTTSVATATMPLAASKPILAHLLSPSHAHFYGKMLHVTHSRLACFLVR